MKLNSSDTYLQIPLEESPKLTRINTEKSPFVHTRLCFRIASSLGFVPICYRTVDLKNILRLLLMQMIFLCLVLM